MKKLAEAEAPIARAAAAPIIIAGAPEVGGRRAVAAQCQLANRLNTSSRAVAQRQLLERMANSPRAMTHRQLVNDVVNSPRVVAQRQASLAQRGSLQAVVQRLKFANKEAKFRTDNEVDDIDNSEYHITANGYERYAPINKYRAPSQFFHEGDRTFMYFDDSVAANALLDEVDAADVRASNDGGTVKFESTPIGLAGPVTKLPDHAAHWSPQNGLSVMDCSMNDEGLIDRNDYHPGHDVEDLGQPLPELDKQGKLEELRILQRWMKHILETGQIRQGAVGEEDLMKAFEAAHEGGQISKEDKDRYEDYKTLLDELFGALEKELLDNWWFWSK